MPIAATVSGGFCIDCCQRVGSFEGLNACPSCGSKSIPCGDEAQVTVSVNWHELRILVIWAERWALKTGASVGTVYSIARRLRNQHADRPPLSLAGDIDELRQAFGPGVAHNIRGIEGFDEGMAAEVPPAG